MASYSAFIIRATGEVDAGFSVPIRAGNPPEPLGSQSKPEPGVRSEIWDFEPGVHPQLSALPAADAWRTVWTLSFRAYPPRPPGSTPPWDES
jgi:hypothetical protein